MSDTHDRFHEDRRQRVSWEEADLRMAAAMEKRGLQHRNYTLTGRWNYQKAHLEQEWGLDGVKADRCVADIDAQARAAELENLKGKGEFWRTVLS